MEDRGFIGVKLYNEYWANEPVLFPLVEACIELRVPILHHAGHTMWLAAAQPKISDGSHFSSLARRYPEAMIICAHICGGGDWEWALKHLRDAPTVYLDTAGSVIDEWMVDKAVARELVAPNRFGSPTRFPTHIEINVNFGLIGPMRNAGTFAREQIEGLKGLFDRINAWRPIGVATGRLGLKNVNVAAI